MIARSTLWGTVQLGDDFYKLSEREQRAVMAHEYGHIHHRHAWKRLGRMLSLRAFRDWGAFLRMCEEQELEADRYAVERGHAPGLLSFLFRQGMHVKSPGYPTARRRIEAIHV